MNKTRLDQYNKLKTAVSSGFKYTFVKLLLRRDVTSGIHQHFCADLPKRPAVCSRCEALLEKPLQEEDTRTLRLLLKHGAYMSENICAAGYEYNHTRSTPLKRAVQSGSLDDVRQLLSEGTDDVNAHPRFCLRSVPRIRRDPSVRKTCADCDTPLMAAVRRKDITMMRLLIAHGASLSEAVRGNFGCIRNQSVCVKRLYS